MLPIHIKVGIIKIFLKTLDHDSSAFKCVQDFRSKPFQGKIKVRVFTEPQIKKIRESKKLPKNLTSVEKAIDKRYVNWYGDHQDENTQLMRVTNSTAALHYMK